jgi:hypothetical protein
MLAVLNEPHAIAFIDIPSIEHESSATDRIMPGATLRPCKKSTPSSSPRSRRDDERSNRNSYRIGSRPSGLTLLDGYHDNHANIAARRKLASPAPRVRNFFV